MALRDWFWVVLVGTIWGSSFFFNAVLIEEIGPMWVSGGRVAIAAIACWLIVIAMRKSLPPFGMVYVHFLVLGALNYAIPFALYPLSEQSIPSGLAAIINALTPITTVIVSHFWVGGEKASWHKAFGVVAGFAGVVLLALPALRSGGHAQEWAIAACLLCTLCYAVALNYTRYCRDVHPSVLAASALTGASIIAVPAAFFFHGVPHLVTLEGWGAMLGISLLSTAFTFQVMYRLLPRIGGTNFSVNTFIAPVSAIILGIAFLNEYLMPSHIAGMALIFIGLLMLDGRILRRLFRRTAALSAQELQKRS